MRQSRRCPQHNRGAVLSMKARVRPLDWLIVLIGIAVNFVLGCSSSSLSKIRIGAPTASRQKRSPLKQNIVCPRIARKRPGKQTPETIGRRLLEIVVYDK